MKRLFCASDAFGVIFRLSLYTISCGYGCIICHRSPYSSSASSSLPLPGKKMTAKCVSPTVSSYCMPCRCVINLLSAPPSHSCSSVSVFVAKMKRIYCHTQRAKASYSMFSHTPCPSLAKQHVCVCVSVCQVG